MTVYYTRNSFFSNVGCKLYYHVVSLTLPSLRRSQCHPHCVSGEAAPLGEQKMPEKQAEEPISLVPYEKAHPHTPLAHLASRSHNSNTAFVTGGRWIRGSPPCDTVSVHVDGNRCILPLPSVARAPISGRGEISPAVRSGDTGDSNNLNPDLCVAPYLCPQLNRNRVPFLNPLPHSSCTPLINPSPRPPPQSP